jgi:Fe-S oxidoreductase
MPDPTAQVYLGAPGWALLWLLTAAAFSLFGVKAARYAAVLRRARPEPRWDQWPRRLRLFAVHVLGQRRLFEEPLIGAAHFLIFWAFVIYASSFFWNLVRGLLPFLPVPYADEVPWMAFAVRWLGIFGLIALAVAAVRRYRFPPTGLEKSTDATRILLLIALVLLTSLDGEEARAAGRPALYLFYWWLHMSTVLGFLAYLPYSKHLHLLASPFGVLFADLKPGRMPAPSEGAAKLEEFTWRELFSGLACAECGRCDRACPAHSSGYALSPKTLMHALKVAVRKGASPEVKPEEIWACVTCRACMDRCPVFNEHIPAIVEMRRCRVAQGDVDPRLQAALASLARYGNSFGQSPRNRGKWTHGLPFRIKDARKEPVEYLWLTGDYAAYDPRVQEVTRASATVFQRAGLDFGILYESEQNSGNDARRAGEEGLFETLRDKNLAAIGKAKFERIVTGDPHAYHALRNEYGREGGVLHVSELLDELLEADRLPVESGIQGAAAVYHDPCYLGRYNGVFGAPRRALAALGAAVLEMPRNRGNSYCCGAGGGRIWFDDASGIKERPAENRVREAASIPGVTTLAVACPKDLVMFHDALKTTGLEGRLAVKDIMQLAEEASRGASA